MTFVEQLDRTISRNHSLLCVGLDPDLSRLSPTFLKTDDPLFSFNKAIIDATKELVCAYKPNSAFYEMHGLVGLAALLKTIEYLHRETNVPVILDAKRGDVGHSSAAYAKAAFEAFKADAVTVNPYLGHDSVKPFLDHQDKGVFILCLTSNPGAEDFEADLYKKVAAKAKEWNKHGNIGLVVGA
ncbi:MAG TPA: orotidine-5'-phosphate decarboxylase, partial [Candidatus Sulfotelmatobacter sp.]|nr:orotidine-5'-phosphate decarboxylase [Candidatus Sulfotelmatobacter sp.]